jgi:prepilin-type N-terminal cleavage/methylation domain-containing protein/prepilin-type processing-associated H-X9-DG protein
MRRDCAVKSRSCPASRSAFSLIELAVVVAIIALLAALLLPVLGRGKAEARRTQCLGQLQQWGKALQMYAHENADLTPRRGQGVRPLTQLNRPEDWFNALPGELSFQGFGDYIGAAGTNAQSPPALFVCPEAQPAPQRYFLTYAMNRYFSPWNLPEPHQLTKIPSPSTAVFLTDGGIGYSSAFPAAAEYSPQPRHRRMANLVFADGHAQGFRGIELGCNSGINRRSDVVWQFDTNMPAFAP